MKLAGIFIFTLRQPRISTDGARRLVTDIGTERYARCARGHTNTPCFLGACFARELEYIQPGATLTLIKCSRGDRLGELRRPDNGRRDVHHDQAPRRRQFVLLQYQGLGASARVGAARSEVPRSHHAPRVRKLAGDAARR